MGDLPYKTYRHLMDWCSEKLLAESVFSVEEWLELSFHLCKQRWDSSVDWLEEQPISKIKLMIDIVKTHAEKVSKESEKASKRKR